MEPKAELKEKRIHEVFFVSLVLKGLNAILEVVLGAALLFTGRLGDFVASLAQNELIEDPHDFIAMSARKLLPYLSPHAQFYGALYLLSHGIIKGALIFALLRNKLWAYPASLAVFSLFIMYQVYKWFETHSPVLVVLTIFDFLVMWLIWHEYRLIKRVHPASNVSAAEPRA